MTPVKVEAIEIQRVFMASTSHVTAEDMALLNPDCAVLVITDYKEGAWIHVPTAETFVDAGADAGLLDALEEAGYTSAVGHLLSVARSHSCDWLRLDADGPIYDFFAQYHW